MRFHALRRLSALLFCTILPFSAQATSLFAYQASVQSLQSSGIIDQGPLVDLRLGETINRAEALKVILKAQPQYASSLGSVAASMPPLSLFPDVDQQAWYAPYVELGFRSKLMTGYPDGTLRPQNGVRVEEAAAMIARSFGSDTASAPFRTNPDLPNREGQWYTGAISVILGANGVMAGRQLHVGEYLVRGDLFEMVERMRMAHGTIGAPTIPSSQPSDTTDGAALQYASDKDFSITIPSLAINDLTVTHPEDPFSQNGVLSVLKDGVGHLFAYPGEGSKVMIYGHSSGFPWDLSKYTKIFRGINKISIGSRIYVTYKKKVFVYQVTEKKTIPAKDGTLFEPDDSGESLMLYTCWPPDSITQRYIVRAVPMQTIALR